MELQREEKSQNKPVNKTPEQLIRENGELVEQLFQSEVWQTIVMPTFEEAIAGVSGRKTNGRYYHGELTRGGGAPNPVFLAGYQKGLMDLWNHLHDFVQAKEKLEAKIKAEKLNSQEKLINPFVEDSDN